MARVIKYRPIEPLNLGIGKDNVNDFGRKYNHEIAHIYDILNNVTLGEGSRQEVDVDTTLNANSTNLVENQAVAKAINALTTNIGKIQGEKANAVHGHNASEIIGLPTTLPASDVYAWAKEEKKPEYCWNEIKCRPRIITEVCVNGYIAPISGGTAYLDLSALFKLKLSDFENDENFITEAQAVEVITNQVNEKARPIILELFDQELKPIDNGYIDEVCV